MKCCAGSSVWEGKEEVALPEARFDRSEVIMRFRDDSLRGIGGTGGMVSEAEVGAGAGVLTDEVKLRRPEPIWLAIEARRLRSPAFETRALDTRDARTRLERFEGREAPPGLLSRVRKASLRSSRSRATCWA